MPQRTRDFVLHTDTETGLTDEGRPYRGPVPSACPHCGPLGTITLAEFDAHRCTLPGGDAA